jgi:thiol:disulfide interchange protein DsbC
VSVLVVLILTLVSTPALSKKTSVEESLKTLFPKLPFKSVHKSGIDGLYEVITENRILYFYPKSGYLFVGDIVTKDGKSITRERLAEESYKKLKTEDLKAGIKIGSGKNIVVEVTDPDCPFCRKMHAYWSMRADVTRYVFLKPLDIHPESLKKVKYILASPDQAKTLFEVYCGKFDNNKELSSEYDDKGKLDQQRKVVEKLQVSGTPTYWVNGRFVSGANIPLIERIIGKMDASVNRGENPEASCSDAK